MFLGQQEHHSNAICQALSKSGAFCVGYQVVTDFCGRCTCINGDAGRSTQSSNFRSHQLFHNLISSYICRTLNNIASPYSRDQFSLAFVLFGCVELNLTWLIVIRIVSCIFKSTPTGDNPSRRLCGIGGYLCASSLRLL